jgi:hypothetical protein
LKSGRKLQTLIAPDESHHAVTQRFPEPFENATRKLVNLVEE